MLETLEAVAEDVGPVQMAVDQLLEEVGEWGGISGAQDVGDLWECQAAAEQNKLKMGLVQRRKKGGNALDFFDFLLDKVGHKFITSYGRSQEFNSCFLHLFDSTP